MQERHKDRSKYFNEQSITTEKYVIPFISDVKSINKETSVLEIGCGEGGNLLPFIKIGCKKIVGIDMSKKKIENAKEFFSSPENSNNIELIHKDIYNIHHEEIGRFDIIIMRDVLEHIHGQEKFMNFVKRFLNPNGKLFLGFPPWYNPFGGHQQICNSKFLSKLPYFHILPTFIYKFILKSFGETKKRIEVLIEIKKTAISIERFERIIKKENYKKDKRTFYFINPNYVTKFGLKERKSWRIITLIPFFRNFFITTNYYLISLRNPLSETK